MWVFWLGLVFVALGFCLGRWYNPDRITAPMAEEGMRQWSELLDILERNGWKYIEATNKVKHPIIANGQPMSITLAVSQLAYSGDRHASTT